jgi:hypothetical protein
MDVASKPEDEILTGQPTSEYDIVAETNQPVPTQPDGFSLRSFAPSDTSPRWSWSSFVDSAKSFSGDFYPGDQYPDLSTPSLENSSRCHDSIGSVLSETYDLDFLTNYDPISLTANQSKRNVWWIRDSTVLEDGDLSNDTFFPVENAVASSSTHDVTRSIPSNSSNAYVFEQPAPFHRGEYSQGKDGMITTGTTLESTLEYSVSMSRGVERAANWAHMPQQEDETFMNWESDHQTADVPEDSRHGQEIIPLTDVQRETLIKWWGKDRFTEQLHSLCGRSSPDEDRTSSIARKDASIGEASFGRRNSLVDKVKGAQFRKGLWRNGSSGKQRK